MSSPRPWLCPMVGHCEPLTNLRDGDYKDITVPEPGQSWTCFGIMAKPLTFIYDGVEHTNDLNHCDYTPLKGVLRFQENEADWSVLAGGFRMALAILERKRTA